MQYQRTIKLFLKFERNQANQQDGGCLMKQSSNITSFNIKLLRMDSTIQHFSMQSTMDEQNCRICLEAVTMQKQKYCECKGNLGYIHFACLKTWAQRTKKKLDQSNNIYIECDVCKSRIYLDFAMKCYCINREELCRLQSQKLWRFISLMLIILTFLGLLLTSVVYYLKDEIDIFFFAVAMVGSGTIVIFFLSLMIFKILITIKEEIQGFTAAPIISPNKLSRVANNFESQETLY